MYGEEDIISAVIHVDETTPSATILLPLTKRESYRRKDVIRRQKENAQDARNFLKQCKKRVPRELNLHVWSQKLI